MTSETDVWWYTGERWATLQPIRLTEGYLLELQGLADRFKSEIWDSGLEQLVQGWAACGVNAMSYGYGGRMPDYPRYYLTTYSEPNGTVTMALNETRDYPFFILRLMPSGDIEPIWLAGGDFASMVKELVAWWTAAPPSDRVLFLRPNPQAVLRGVMLYYRGAPRGPSS